MGLCRQDLSWSFQRNLTMLMDSEGLACVKLNGKRGYIDTTGKVVISAQFGGYGFSEGVAGYTMVSGATLTRRKRGIPAQFDHAIGFSAGLALVEINRKWGYVDKRPVR